MSFLFFIFASSFAQAATASDVISAEVRFTNPLCRTYKYRDSVYSRSGDKLNAKPKNAFCTGNDVARSTSRSTSPQYKLLQWINDKATKEIFLSYLSFSNKPVASALCRAVRQRNVKLRFILDANTELERYREVENCSPGNVEIKMRGHVRGIDYAHVKLMIINPRDKNSVRLVFGSANLTNSGLSTNHENWNFFEVRSDSHFAQSHLCLMNGLWENADSGRQFRNYIENCRDDIPAREVSGLNLFVVPGEGRLATRKIDSSAHWSRQIDLAAHRFSYSRLISILLDRLSSRSFDLRMLVDDDTFWAGETGETLNANMPMEYYRLNRLKGAGAKVKYMQTNHDTWQLHHNKFIVFKKGSRTRVFTGAGNFTGTAFSSNLENFYLLDLPQITAKYRRQYERLFSDLASFSDDLPRENELP